MAAPVGTPNVGTKIYRDLAKYESVKSENDLDKLPDLLSELSNNLSNINNEREITNLVDRLTVIDSCINKISPGKTSPALNELQKRVEKCKQDLSFNMREKHLIRMKLEQGLEALKSIERLIERNIGNVTAVIQNCIEDSAKIRLNDTLRDTFIARFNKIKDLANAAKSEQGSVFETRLNTLKQKIEEGLKKTLSQLNQSENDTKETASNKVETTTPPTVIFHHEGDAKVEAAEPTSSETPPLSIENLKKMLDKVHDNKAEIDTAMRELKKFLKQYKSIEEVTENQFIYLFIIGQINRAHANLETLKRNGLAEGVWAANLLTECTSLYSHSINRLTNLHSHLIEIGRLTSVLNNLKKLAESEPPLSETEKGYIETIRTHVSNYREKALARLPESDGSWKRENSRIDEIDRIMGTINKIGAEDLSVTEEGHLGTLTTEMLTRRDEIFAKMNEEERSLYTANAAWEKHKPQFKKVETALNEFHNKKEGFSDPGVIELLVTLDDDKELENTSLLLVNLKHLKYILETILNEDIHCLPLNTANDIADYINECEKRIFNLEKRTRKSEGDTKEAVSTSAPHRRIKVSKDSFKQLTAFIKNWRMELEYSEIHVNFINKATDRIEALLTALNTADFSKITMSSLDRAEFAQILTTVETAGDVIKKLDEPHQKMYISILNKARSLSAKLAMLEEGSDYDSEDEKTEAEPTQPVKSIFRKRSDRQRKS